MSAPQAPTGGGYHAHYAALGNTVPDWNAALPWPAGTPWLPVDRATPVLDIGCGFGGHLSRLAASGYTDLTGVDAGADMIARASAAAGHGRARWAVSDGAVWLADHPDSYGLILMMDVIEHLPDDRLIPWLEAARRALRPGGVLVVRTPNMVALGAGMSRHIDLTHRAGFTEFSLRQALQLAGLEDVRFVADPAPAWFSGWRPWAPWRGLRLRFLLNRWLHQAVYALRDQRPRPSRFAINLEAWARRPARHEHSVG